MNPTVRPCARSTYTNSTAADGTALFWYVCWEWYSRICGTIRQRALVGSTQTLSTRCFHGTLTYHNTGQHSSCAVETSTDRLVSVRYQTQLAQEGNTNKLDNQKLVTLEPTRSFSMTQQLKPHINIGVNVSAPTRMENVQRQQERS